MQIKEINYDEKRASLVLSRDEVHKLRSALSTVVDLSNEKSSEDVEWLHLQLVCVDDILKDGNFTRLLGYHRRLIESELEEKETENEGIDNQS